MSAWEYAWLQMEYAAHPRGGLWRRCRCQEFDVSWDSTVGEVVPGTLHKEWNRGQCIISTDGQIIDINSLREHTGSETGEVDYRLRLNVSLIREDVFNYLVSDCACGGT